MAFHSALTLTDPGEYDGRPGLPRPAARSLKPDAPALELMTDFCHVPAISVPATLQIDAALDRMIYSGVRLLFVVGSKFELRGAITSYDIQGEKPLRYLQSKDCRINTCSRNEIIVQDIMTPVADWRVLRYEQLAYATVGDIAQTFKGLGQRHIIVMETRHDTGSQFLRGLFSASALEAALGAGIAIEQAATNFADIERALLR